MRTEISQETWDIVDLYILGQSIEVYHQSIADELEYARTKELSREDLTIPKDYSIQIPKPDLLSPISITRIGY